MCDETKAFLVSLSLFLVVVASCCVYQTHPEKRVGRDIEIKSQSPCENYYKKFCLNGGECYYPVDEDIVACNCTWLYGGKCCEKYMWWT